MMMALVASSVFFFFFFLSSSSLLLLVLQLFRRGQNLPRRPSEGRRQRRRGKEQDRWQYK